MSELWVIRHAHALSEQECGVLDDFDRVLSRRGQREAEALGAFLAARSPEVRLLVSSAARTRETAESIARALGARCNLSFERELYGASMAQWLARLAALASTDSPPACVGIVGHNPGIASLASQLATAAGVEAPPYVPASCTVWTLPTGFAAPLRARPLRVDHFRPGA